MKERWLTTAALGNKIEVDPTLETDPDEHQPQGAAGG